MGTSLRGSTRATLTAAVLALAAVFADEPARFLVLRDPPRDADAALVMAGDPGYERTRTGARLVLAGEARLLILTGGEPGPGDSATSLRDVALGLGVPPEAIRIEQVSRSTHESLLAVRPILEHEGMQTRGGRDVALPPAPGGLGRAPHAARRRGRQPARGSRELAAFGLVEDPLGPADRAGGIPEARLLHLAGLGLTSGPPRTPESPSFIGS